MTYRKKLAWLGSIIGVLLLALVLGSVFSLSTRNVASVKEPVFPGLKKDRITAVDITAPSGGSSDAAGATPGVSLARTPDGGWEVKTPGGSYPADPQQVDSFLGDVSALETTRHVTGDKSLYPDFGVDAASAHVVTLTVSDGRKLTLDYGKDEVGGGYIRVGTDPMVYLADKSLNFYVTRDVASWYDLRMLPHGLKFDNVETIDYQFSPSVDSDQKSIITPTSPPPKSAADLPARYEKQGYRLVRRATSSGLNNWFLESDLALSLNQQEVEAVARSAVQLDGSSFVTSPVSGEVTGLGSPGLTATLIMSDGSRYAIKIGKLAGKDVFYGQVEGPDIAHDASGDPYLYEVSRYSLERAFEPLAKLVEQSSKSKGGATSGSGSGPSGGPAGSSGN